MLGLLATVRATPVRTAAGALTAGLLLGYTLPLSALERERCAPGYTRFVTYTRRTARAIFDDLLARLLGT